MNKNPINKFMGFFLVTLVKILLKNKSAKSFLVSKYNISQSRDILIDIVNIRGMKYSNNCYLKINGCILFGLVSLFNGISTLFRLFNAKYILLEEQ